MSTASTWFDDLVAELERTDSIAPSVASLSVTWRALTLGDADAVTGWFKKYYSESTIKMILSSRDVHPNLTGIGFLPRYNNSGITTSLVTEGDEIKRTEHGNTVYYEVKSYVDHWNGNLFLVRECELVKLDFHE